MTTEELENLRLRKTQLIEEINALLKTGAGMGSVRYLADELKEVNDRLLLAKG